MVSQGDPVNVLILEIDGDRRRLSLSLKRVEEGAVPVPRADGGASVHTMPDLKLSEEAFLSSGAVATEDEPAEPAEEPAAEAVEDPVAVAEADEPVAEVEAEEAENAEEPEVEEPVAEADPDKPAAEDDLESSDDQADEHL